MTRGSILGRVVLLGVVVLSAGGAWISGLLVKDDAGLWRGEAAATSLYARVCRAGETFGLGCDREGKGGWSQIRLPLPLPTPDLSITWHVTVVPVAFAGLAYFVFQGLWFAFIGGPRAPGRRWHRLPTVLALGGAMVSMFYLGATAVGLAPKCVWCTAVHLINLVMVTLIWRLSKCRADHDLRRSPTGPSGCSVLTLREVTTVVSFSLVAVLGLWLYRRDQLAFHRQYEGLVPYRAMVTGLRDDRAFVLREFRAQARRYIPPRAGQSAASDAARLVVFTDYQCSSCYCTELAIRQQYVPAFDGWLKVSVRHLPLCRECNDAVGGEVHPQACRAAYAAQAAGLQGGDPAFETMHQLLFENRDRLGDGVYRELADRIGLDGERLLQDMADPAVRRIVAADVALAAELGVEATPTIFLDGRRVTRLLADSPVFWNSVADVLQSEPPDQAETLASAEAGLTR